MGFERYFCPSRRESDESLSLQDEGEGNLGIPSSKEGLICFHIFLNALWVCLGVFPECPPNRLTRRWSQKRPMTGNTSPNIYLLDEELFFVGAFGTEAIQPLLITLLLQSQLGENGSPPNPERLVPNPAIDNVPPFLWVQ
jgi:hypothetical protein